MYIKNMIDLQAELDEMVEERNDIELSSDENVRNRVLAYKVELGELANEIGFFKYWKQSHQLDFMKLGDELADVIHLLLSVGISRKYTPMFKEIEPFPFYEDAEFQDMFEQLFRNELDSSAQWHHAMSIILGIGLKLGFTESEIYDLYEYKNTINRKRQEGGY